MRHLPLRQLLACLAIASTLAFLVGQADARVGGGSSSGSRGSRTYSAPAPTRTAPSTAAPIERSMTQPGAVARPNAATQGAGGGLFNRPGGLFGGGLLGGLAAGFLGAGLFGMLFGHGLFGGLGGIASFLGLILQVGIVALVAMLAFRWWQRRNQPAYAAASGPALRDISPGSFGANTTGGGGMAQPVASEPIEIAPADFDTFERLLGDIQTAFSAEDLNALRTHATPEMVSYFSEQLAENASRGVVNKISDVKLLQGDLAEAWREGDSEYATVAMHFGLIDKTVDRTTGRVVEGSDAPQEVTELWTFRRSRNGNWLLSAIQQAS